LRVTARAVVLFALIVLAVSACRSAAADKIAYINSDQILSEYSGAKDIQGQLSTSVADWKQQAQDMEAEINKMISDLQSQQLMLSDQAVNDKQTAIQEKRTEYESFVNDVWGQGGLAARKEAELWQPVFDKVNKILGDIGREEEYTLILDAAAGAVVYADPALDITQMVIDRLNGESE
jgi:outer membrane protein